MLPTLKSSVFRRSDYCLKNDHIATNRYWKEIILGRAKETMIEREDSLNTAKAFLVEVGTLEECERHGYIVKSDEDLERLWPIAMAERKKGGRGRVPWPAISNVMV